VDLATFAQLASAGAEFFLALVFAAGYYIFLKQNREMLREMRASRTAGGRPQVVVEAGYAHLPMVEVVVRNVGGGAAQDIEFDFSASLVRSTGYSISDLSYFKEGMNFLDSGEEVRSLWDEFNELASTLREEGLESGITVTVRYKDLAGDPYQDRWNINPLLYEDESTGLGGLKGVNELVLEVEKLTEHVEEISRGLTSRQRDERAEASNDDDTS
jgi:hypothetical protein